MDLSIIVPCCGGRPKRVEAIISRLSLNKQLHPEINFELIIIDGSKTAEYQALAEYCCSFINLKYIAVPIGRFINAGYPRNIGMRAAEGRIIAGIDIDYWLGEHFIVGAIKPFEKKSVLNQGYVIDTSKSDKVIHPPQSEELNTLILSDKATGAQILDVFHKLGVPAPCPSNKVWLWAVPNKVCQMIRGYDEIYCRSYSYSREDDDWFYRLSSLLSINNDYYNEFCAMHLWHPAVQRNQASNKLNKEYYKQMGQEHPISTIRNVDWDYGKMLKHGFAYIDEQHLSTLEFEKWMYSHNKINYIENPEWASLDVYILELEKYIGNKI